MVNCVRRIANVKTQILENTGDRVHKRKNKKIHIKKGRIIFIIVVLLFLFSALLGRLFYIMTVKGNEYTVLAANQWLNKEILPPTRGKILDRNGQELAISLDVYKIEADLSILLATILEEEITVEKLSLDLSRILDLDVKGVSKILKSTNSAGEPLKFVSMKRRVDKKQADAIKALKLSGFIITPDIKRYYPNNNFRHKYTHIF